MKNLQELLKQDPKALAAYALELQEALREQKQQLNEIKEQLKQAQTLIAELKQELFGPKADKLTKEQEEQLRQLVKDEQEQSQKPSSLSQEVLQEELKKEREHQRKQAKERLRRHLTPVKLEEQIQVLEPQDSEKLCPITGKARRKIGQEITTEYDLIPARLIIRKIVRPKYGCCQTDCECGVVIAPLPERLVPQGKLGLGLAVHLLLSRFDDHVAYYTLERNFAERFGMIIPRQQMVQWVEKIAFLLEMIYNLIWEEMRAGPYVQIDETPVKVLDPEVKGKAAKGYLWFYSVPGGDVFLEFDPSRGHQVPLERLEGFRGTLQSDGYGAYETLEKKLPGVRRIGCLAYPFCKSV